MFPKKEKKTRNKPYTNPSSEPMQRFWPGMSKFHFSSEAYGQ